MTKIRRLRLLVLLAALAACGSPRAAGVPRPSGVPDRGVGGGGGASAARPFVPPADPLDALPATGPVARYAGPFAREPAVLKFQRDAGAVLDASIVRLREETRLQFLEARTPRIVIVDAPEAAAAGRAELRLADGVRRPEIRVPAAALAAGEFRTNEDLPALVAEAAILAMSPERAPPEWIVRGVPPVFARTVDRRAAELVAGGTRIRASVETLAPLEPAFRVAALQRIGVGDRVLARFLDARLGGAGDTAALREVGVGSMEFLDAAAATDASRALERVIEDPRVDSLRAVRAALAAGDAGSADAALSQMAAADVVTPWVDAEVGLVRAETSLLRDEAPPAIAALDDVLARPETVLRMRDARFLRALAASRAGDATARSRAAEFARLHLTDPRTPEILADLGVATQDAFDLASADASARARAATRIGQSDRASAAPYLAASLRDGDATVRQAIVQALSRLGGADSVAAVAAATGDSDGGVRAAALTALALADPERGLRRAQELAGDPDALARAVATAVVAASAPKPVVPKPGVARPADRAAERRADRPAETPPAATPPTAKPRPPERVAPVRTPVERKHVAPPPPPAARLPRAPKTQTPREAPPPAKSVTPPAPGPRTPLPAGKPVRPADVPPKPSNPSPPPPAPNR